MGTSNPKRAPKYVSAFAAFGSGDLRAISPATRLASASNHLSLVVVIAPMASPMQRHALSNWPRPAWAVAKSDVYNGKSLWGKAGQRSALIEGSHIVDPVARQAAIPELMVSTASAERSFRVKAQPRATVPPAFQNNEDFSSAKVKSS